MINKIHLQASPRVALYTRRLIVVGTIITIVFMFLPSTQNIQTTGVVTTLRPSERPQSIQTVISGQILKWYVKDGDQVNEGDTIAVLTETKSEYLDPDLIDQTSTQIKAKENSILSYSAKVNAINQQITQLEANRDFAIQKARVKLQQEKLRYSSEFAEMQAANINLKIAQDIYNGFSNSKRHNYILNEPQYADNFNKGGNFSVRVVVLSEDENTYHLAIYCVGVFCDIYKLNN
jgi:multidrug efflux pump subunit AcrA (membrane-fusion protein)